MQYLLELDVADNSCIRILQLTDMHLFADPKAALLGIATHASFQAVLSAIAEQNLNPDLIIASGDISQDQSQASYQAFATMVAALKAPCVWVPGNHDSLNQMSALLATAPLSAAKQVLACDDWQIILLDSRVENKDFGRLAASQSAFLRQCLSAYPDRFAVVVMHHPPFIPNGGWLQELILQQAEELMSLMAAFPLANTLLCGHIHQAQDLQWQDIRLLTTPSTCIQFAPQSSIFKLDIEPPGWRWLELYPDGNIVTQVERLSPSPFQPDLAAGGY